MAGKLSILIEGKGLIYSVLQGYCPRDGKHLTWNLLGWKCACGFSMSDAEKQDLIRKYSHRPKVTHGIGSEEEYLRQGDLILKDEQ